MCDLSLNLVAWLDGELSPGEAAAVASHLETCEECRRRCDALRDTGESVRLYSDAILAAQSRPAVPRRSVQGWVPALTCAAVAAAMLVLFFVPRRPPAPPDPIEPPVMASTVAPEALPSPSPHKQVHKSRPRPAAPRPEQPWPPADTQVEIAIPAEAVFAPGALPEGMNLVAEISIAPDGSLREVRLRQ
jgi:anti-sigma factor RsiW